MTGNYYIDQHGTHFHMTEADAEEFTGLTKITTPKPDDGKEYRYSLANDGWEEVIQTNPTTAELMDRVCDVLGVTKSELTTIINDLIIKYRKEK